MSTVREIEEAIARLPREQARQVAEFLNTLLEEDWDRELERDALPGGRLDRKLQGIREQIAQGRTTPIPR
jgi:hypothetical protein